MLHCTSDYNTHGDHLQLTLLGCAGAVPLPARSALISARGVAVCGLLLFPGAPAPEALAAAFAGELRDARLGPPSPFPRSVAVVAQAFDFSVEAGLLCGRIAAICRHSPRLLATRCL